MERAPTVGRLWLRFAQDAGDHRDDDLVDGAGGRRCAFPVGEEQVSRPDQCSAMRYEAIMAVASVSSGMPVGVIRRSRARKSSGRR